MPHPPCRRGDLCAQNARAIEVQADAFTLAKREQQKLPGEGCLFDIGQLHIHDHLSQMDEPFAK